MLRNLPLIFMGTPQFSVPILQILIEAKSQIVAVYSQPARPQGRGYKVEPSPIEKLAHSYNIPVYTPTHFKDSEVRQVFIDLVKKHHVQIAVVAAYGLLLPEDILNAPFLGCINVHASLLPRWRGASPIQHAILEGDAFSGVTIMKMDKGLDTGPVLLERECIIEREETSASLQEKLSQLGAHALVQALDLYVQQKIDPVPQPLDGATYAGKIPKEAGKLSFSNKPACMLERQVRAFTPWPGCFFEIKEEKLKVLKAYVMSKEEFAFKISSRDRMAGIVAGDNLEIMCADGNLFCPQVVQRAGAKPLDVKSFLRGFSLVPGDRVIA